MAHPGGRPTKYTSEMCDKVIEYMSQGATKTGVAARLGISKETLYQWSDPDSKYFNKEFSDSLKRGMDLSQDFWEELGLQLVLQGQGNATAWIFNMKNRFRDDWADRTYTDITTGGKPVSSILSNVSSDKSDQEATETE